MRALIASGTGRYADPWHPFPRTSHLIAKTLQRADFAVDIDQDVDGAMTRLEGFDLLVVNAGDPWRTAEIGAPPAESIMGFDRALRRGIGIIAVHSATSSLRDYPEWYPAIGGMWVPSVSNHPPADETEIMGVHNPEHIEIEPFSVFDERYCRLQTLGASTVVAQHAGVHGAEPTAWVRRVGSARIAVDLLGHNDQSYASPGRCALLVALARWATAGASTTGATS